MCMQEERIDTHLHLPLPGTSWVPMAHRGNVRDFVGDDMVRTDISERLHSAGLPVHPGWIAPLEIALKNNSDSPNKFVAITVDVPDDPHPSNEMIRKLVEVYPEHVIGSISVHPKTVNAPNVLAKEFIALSRLYSRLRLNWRPVLKLHPIDQKFDISSVSMEFWNMVAEFTAITAIHTGPRQLIQDPRDIIATDPALIKPIAILKTMIDFILVHMGTPDSRISKFYEERGRDYNPFLEALHMIMEMSNVYGDMAGLNWVSPGGGNGYTGKDSKGKDMGKNSDWAFETLRTRSERDPIIKDKLVFGSDFPLTGPKELKLQRKLLGFDPSKTSRKLLSR